MESELELELVNRAALSDADLAALRLEIAKLDTLEDVFRFVRGSGLHDGTEHLVVQDEYTHDAVFPHRDGLFLVYGLT